MKKEKSSTRQEYEKLYRFMRRGFEIETLVAGTGSFWNALKAADYSYQARDYDVHVWSTNERHKRFHQIWWRILTQRGDLPF